MRLARRFGTAIILCLGLSQGFHAIAHVGTHASLPLAGPGPHSFPPGALRLYRTGGDVRVLRTLDSRSLVDLPVPLLHTGLRPVANEYPVIVATSNGAKFAAMYNIHPNDQVIRSRDLTLQLFDARSDKPISPRHHPAVPVWINGISSDGSIVYGFGVNTNLNTPCGPSPFYLLDTRTGRLIQHFSIAARPWDSVLVGPNLQRLYIMTTPDHINSCGPQWSYSPTVTAYDLQTGKMVRTLYLKGMLGGRWDTSRTLNGDLIGAEWYPGFALSPDGSQLAVLDGHSDMLTLLRARSLQIAGTETVSRPRSGLSALVAFLGLQPGSAEAKGQWNGVTLQMQYAAGGRSLLVTGAQLRPDSHHRYASSRSLGIRLIDIAHGQIRAWLDENKQIIGLWAAPDGSGVYSAVQGWSRQAGWLTTLRYHDPATLRVRASRTFEHMGNWFLTLFFLQRQG